MGHIMVNTVAAATYCFVLGETSISSTLQICFPRWTSLNRHAGNHLEVCVCVCYSISPFSRKWGLDGCDFLLIPIFNLSQTINRMAVHLPPSCPTRSSFSRSLFQCLAYRGLTGDCLKLPPIVQIPWIPRQHRTIPSTALPLVHHLFFTLKQNPFPFWALPSVHATI